MIDLVQYRVAIGRFSPRLRLRSSLGSANDEDFLSTMMIKGVVVCGVMWCVVTIIQGLDLLMLCGDVESNPGPATSPCPQSDHDFIVGKYVVF